MEGKAFWDILDVSLIRLGSGFNLTVLEAIELVLLFVGTFVALALIKKAIYRSKKLDLAKKYSFNNLIKYVVYTVAIVTFFHILDFDLKYILAGSAALLVGVGIGLQHLFGDFVSGIVILIDSSIKVGDIIDVDGLICRVEEINLRTTLVLTRDDKFILLPNNHLTKHKVVNWTHSMNASRFEVDVRVDYSSDVALTMRAIKEAALEEPAVLDTPVPFVRFNEYGQHSLDFTLYFWTTNIFRVENTKSDLRVRIFDKLKANGISVPLPQRVISMRHEKVE